GAGWRGDDPGVAVSAGGRTPFVLGAVDVAVSAGALTACVVSAEGTPLARACEREIAVVVGPELVAGSTRLKAGTAQKLVLNTISTASLVRLGKTFGNLMVDVQAENEKLRARARHAVAIATGASTDAVDKAITPGNGDP